MAITLDGTNGISTPDVEPTGSTVPTNGLYLPAANSVGIATNSTNAVYINSSQNVGIGTSSPSFSTGSGLQVNRAGTSNIRISNSTTSLATELYQTDTTSGFTIDARGTNNFTRFLTDGTERGRFDASGNFQFNSGYGSVATAYGCRAWVNFNGTGTVAIRASGNVSSITDNGTGDYTVNFTSALVDANYAVSIGGVKNDTNPDGNFRATFGQTNTLPSTSGFRVVTAYATGGNQDFPAVACAVFR